MIESVHQISTRYWRKLDNDHVVCLVCPRECELREGKRGVCYIRMAEGGEIVLTSYGLSSGFCIDPIEKKPLNHFLPGTPVLSFGTAGCNLTCKFCQNWEISKSRHTETISQVASPEQIAKKAQEYGCRSIAFTYNDPVIFMEYAMDVAKACHAVDVKTVAVTAGYINPLPRKEFFSHIDAANVDLKGFTESFYHRICGGHLAPVLDTLLYLKHETSVWFEITTLLIPGENDSAGELEDLCRWVEEALGPDVPIHFTAFHPDFHMLDKSATSVNTLMLAYQIAKNMGLEYVYIGNVYAPQLQSTYCPKCGELLISRDGYTLEQWHLNGNACVHCGHKIPGVFEATPGQWGSRRIPILFSRE